MGGSVMRRREDDGLEGKAAVRARRQELAKKKRGVLLRDITPAYILVLADKVKEEKGLGWRDTKTMARGLAYLKWASFEQVSAFARSFPYLCPLRNLGAFGTDNWCRKSPPQNRTTALRFRAGPPGALPFYRARQARPSPRPCRSVRLSPSARERIR
jgi:hypothetical protein